jgi:hypothetical protein
MTYRRFRLPTILWFGGGAVLFALWAVVRECVPQVVGATFTGAAVAAAVTAIVFTFMLVWPEQKWVRVAAVVMPPITLGLRMISLALDRPVHWAGLVFAVIIAFAYTVAGPQMMPPPVSNGHVKHLLGGDDG